MPLPSIFKNRPIPLKINEELSDFKGNDNLNQVKSTNNSPEKNQTGSTFKNDFSNNFKKPIKSANQTL